jgi:nicotinamide mononucleotide (NMN) deamidase PncC
VHDVTDLAVHEAYFQSLGAVSDLCAREIAMTAKLITVVCVTVLITSLLMVTVLHSL